MRKIEVKAFEGESEITSWDWDIRDAKQLKNGEIMVWGVLNLRTLAEETKEGGTPHDNYSEGSGIAIHANPQVASAQAFLNACGMVNVLATINPLAEENVDEGQTEEKKEDGQADPVKWENAEDIEKV